MFSNKIIWLGFFAILPMSSWAQTNATQVLSERAHYWENLGRSDMAAQTWRELLSFEPDNAEAQAALAGVLASTTRSATQTLTDRARYWKKLGRHDMAADVWRALLTIDPENLEALAELSRDRAASAAVAAEKVPVVSAKPNAEVTPVTLLEPVAVAEPVAIEAPVAETAPADIPAAAIVPVVNAKPEAAVEPISNAEAIAETVPAANPLVEAAAHAEPVAEPVAIEAPAAGTAPAVIPAAAIVPVVSAKPNAEVIPVTLLEPVAVAEPVAIEAPVSETAPAEIPAAAIVPVVSAKPNAEVTPVTLLEPVAVAEPVAIEAPVAETAPADISAAAIVPVVSAKPDADVIRFLNGETVVEAAAHAEPVAIEAPAAETAPADIPAAAIVPVVSAKPEAAVEPISNTEPVAETVSSAKPVVEAAAHAEPVAEPVAIEAPAAETAPAGISAAAIVPVVSVKPEADVVLDAAPIVDVAPGAEAVVSAPIVTTSPLHSPVKQVEDWADLYPEGEHIKEDLHEDSDTPAVQPLNNEQPAKPAQVAQAESPMNEISMKAPEIQSEKTAVALSDKSDVLKVLVAPEPSIKPASVSLIAPQKRDDDLLASMNAEASGKIAVKILPEMNVIAQPSDAIPEKGGLLTLSDAPTDKELQDRAAYWDHRGRSDLAAKVRSQIKPVIESPVVRSAPVASPVSAAPAVSVIQNVSAASAVSAIPKDQTVEKPASPEERAQYWGARGRSDLAAQVLGQTATADSRISQAQVSQPVISNRQISDRTLPRPMANTVVLSSAGHTNNGLPAPTGAKLSRQELDESAQYWEERGRSDLAAQLRQKLDAAPPVSVSGKRNSLSRVDERIPDNQIATRIALEDSLLKHPNSLKTRLDLVQIYRSAGELTNARLQIESLLAASPDLPDALFASAQLYADQRLWLDAMRTLERISPASRTADMGKLQKTSWAHLQLDRADILVRQGKSAEAELLLRQVAIELAVNYNQSVPAEPPPLWKSDRPKAARH